MLTYMPLILNNIIFKKLKTFLKIKEVESNLTLEIESVRKELSVGFENVRKDLSLEINKLDAKTTLQNELLRRDLKIWLGSLLVLGIGVLASLMTFLAHVPHTH